MSVRERTVGFLQQRVLTPMALGVIILSLTLTAAFLGLVGLISGADLNVITRLPAYSLVMGIVFVVAILRLDSPNRDGMMVLVSTSGIAVLAFVLVGLATEGVMYTYNSPEEVVMSNLIFYFAAAGMVCTGVVFWALHHWREFATNDSRL
ncbi:hypothetical protein OB920_06330 [Halobacteria archaeon HArc-gm2]|nr:hypothetical protein [Halobacteria archaeon HArc-gm2]